jgi:hypothetical protein
MINACPLIVRILPPGDDLSPDNVDTRPYNGLIQSEHPVDAARNDPSPEDGEMVVIMRAAMCGRWTLSTPTPKKLQPCSARACPELCCRQCL